MNIKHDEGKTDLSDLDIHQLRSGLELLEDRLKRDRRRVDGVVPDAAKAIDVEIENLKGRPTEPGLMARMGIQVEVESDPAQLDIEGAVRYDTHSLSVTQVRERVSAIVAKHSNEEAIPILQQMKRGENERPGGGPRKGALEILTSAINALERMGQE